MTTTLSCNQLVEKKTKKYHKLCECNTKPSITLKNQKPPNTKGYCAKCIPMDTVIQGKDKEYYYVTKRYLDKYEVRETGKGVGPAWKWLDCDDEKELIRINKRQSKRTKKKGGSNTKKKTKKGGSSKLEKDYLQICSKAEKNKRLNKDQRNFDCDTMIYNYNTDEATKSDLRFYINWYKKGIKRGELDWDYYDTYQAAKKKKKRTKRTKRKSM